MSAMRPWNPLDRDGLVDRLRDIATIWKTP
jgi:hypothetical protein